MKWLAVIAGVMSAFGGVTGILDDPLGFGRTWILYFYQIMFGLILIGNEVPIPAICRHFPTLNHYDGKGFFLIFVATFMFGTGAGWRQDALWRDWLTDLCALALVVKGVCCLLLAFGGAKCCPACFSAEAATIAGANTGV